MNFPFGTNGKFIILGVPILKHIRVNCFSDPTFGNQITDFPFEIPLGEFIMSGVQLDDVDRNLKVVVYRCYATPTNNRADPLNHTLIENK